MKTTRGTITTRRRDNTREVLSRSRWRWRCWNSRDRHLICCGGRLGREVKAEEMQKLTLRVNGRAHCLLVRASMVPALRAAKKMGTTGTEVGAKEGSGACAVLINQVPRYACMTLALGREGEGPPRWRG